jgi:Zn-dependent protease with chaperone function
LLFSQIISFILVMVLWEAYPPAPPGLGPLQSLGGSLVLAAWLWVGSRLRVLVMLRRISGPHPPPDPARAARRAVTELHVAALVCVAVMVALLDLKAYLLALPGVAASETLSGLCAVGLYFGLLSVVWAATHPLEKVVFQQPLGRGAFVRSQARFVAPVVFPWLGVVALRDLLGLAWPQARSWLDTAAGDLIFLGVFVLMMALFFPPLVRGWWGCRPWPRGAVREIASQVLEHTGVKVAGILSWPIMQGRLLTAGILGVAPRFRYLLITQALVESLSAQELAGVVAHEAGHVRHRHLVSYILFFLGFFAAAYALAGPLALGLNWLLVALAGTDWGLGVITGQGSAWLQVVLALPLVALLVVYLRFVMGWFMRNFERQADLFALTVMGESRPLAGALEKVAGLSGNTRDVPSWHHYSIRQRVETLRAAESDPGLIARHRGAIKKALALYLAGLAAVMAMGLGVGGAGLGQGLQRELAARILASELERRPRDPALHRDLGVLYFEAGREAEALRHLTTAVGLEPRDPEALNGLAWALATAGDPGLRRPREAVELARRAVRLKPAAHIWDTLAEAYHASGRPGRALAAARAAAAAAGPAGGPPGYYQRQLRRFRQAAQGAGG